MQYPIIISMGLSGYLNTNFPRTAITVPSIPKIIPVTFKIPSNAFILGIFSSSKRTSNRIAHTGAVGSNNLDISAERR